MANTGSQAEAIRDLLIERLQVFDPNLDTREGSPLFNQVVQPIFTALGTDPFDSDIDQFLKDRLRQEFPSVSASDGEAIVDLLIRPLQLLFEALKRETQIVRRGQSTRNSSTMRLEDAEALAANWFVNRRTGLRTTGTVRVFYSAPTFVSVLSTVIFETGSGLRFFPIRPQFFTPEVVLLQRQGTLYYVDINVVAEEAGDAYNITDGEISRVVGLPGAARVTNLESFDNGLSEEDSSALLDRTEQSLTERSLNTQRGIAARLLQDFPEVRNLEVSGYGDPEMNRDIITGKGHGRIISSGICFIVGQFCLMFSQYEDRGDDGLVRVRQGDEVDLNYWRFLYDVEPHQAHEQFIIENILFDTRDLFEEDLPSVLLFQMSGTPTAPQPAAATLPGVLPGVFAAIRTRGVIEISDIPGGITNPDTPRGTILIEDNEVHVGGHYDVWLRPSVDLETVTEPNVRRSEAALLESEDLFTSGSSLRFKNQVHRLYKVFYSVLTGSLQLGEPIDGADSEATAVILEKTADYLVLGEFGEDAFEIETITGRFTGAQASITEIESLDWSIYGVLPGMLLTVVGGNDSGVYKILRVDGPFLYLDTDLTETDQNLPFRIIEEVHHRVFNPKDILVPFGTQKADDLITVIGSNTVRTSTDLKIFGVDIGDSMEILEGPDQGVYTISDFDSSLGGKAPILSTPMTGTASGLDFRVFRSGTPLQSPLVRVIPGGVHVLDPSGQDSGNVIPYALPVEGRALEAFSGASASAAGLNGFVLADPGPEWEPEGDLTCDPEDFEDAKTCFSDECLECENGYIACATFMDDGNFYIDSQLPTAAVDFLKDLRQWFLDIIETFELGDDISSFVDGFHPFILGPPDTSVSNILKQFEICIPAEIFDGCNNVFVALPEFNWKAEFEEGGIPADTGTITFSEVLDKFNNGELEGSGAPPALLQAKPGCSLTVLEGANAGSYLIDRIFHYKLCHGGAILDEGSEVIADLDKCYDVAVAVIKGAFPVKPLTGLKEFFDGGVPELTVPLPPSLDVECTDLPTGTPLSPWEVFEKVLTWVFQWLDSMGFDLPDEITLDAGEVLKALWQLLFHPYVVGCPTCKQNVRLTFVEPTSITAFGALPCVGWEYNAPAGTPAELSGENLTVPLPDLNGAEATVVFEDSLGTTTLSGTLGAGAAAATTLSALATELQTLLDPDGSFLSFTGTLDATGPLEVSTVKKGTSVKLSVDATDLADAFRAFGYFDDTGDKWAFMYHEEALSDAFRVTIPSTGGFALIVNLATVGATSYDFTLTPGTYSWDDIVAAFQTRMNAVITDLETVVAPGNDYTGVVSMEKSTLLSSTRFGIKLQILHVSGPNPIDTGASSPFITAPGVGVDHRSLLGDEDNVILVSTEQSVFLEDFAGISDLHIQVEDDTATTFDCDKAWTSYADQITEGWDVAFNYAVDNPGAADQFDQLAQLLNADSDIYGDGSERRVWFVGGDRLEARAVLGGTGSTLRVQVASADNGYAVLGFADGTTFSDDTVTLVGDDLEVLGTEPDNNSEAEGSIEVGDLVTGVFEPPEPTLFSAVVGSAELLYAACGDIEPFQVFPGENSAGRIPPTRLPRDVVVSEDYDGATANILRFSNGGYPAPLAAGVREHWDFFWLYEQRIYLEHTIADYEDNITKDRVIAVRTVFGSPVITLPSANDPDFNFLDSTTDDEFDEIKVGDLVFIEEGEDAGGYVVIARDEFKVTLDQAMTESSERLFRSDNDGVIESDTNVLRSGNANFTEGDIGRYLTIWATNREDYDGSYRITAVTDLGTHTEATLDTGNFPDTEQEIHWAVVKAPVEEPGASRIDGRTALVGVRPIRVYSGEPAKFRVAAVSGHLERTLSELLIMHSDESPPKDRVKQPYQIIRDGVQHLSSTAMKGQGRELGLYYFDVLSLSLGGDVVYNIPENTRLEPIFGTYESEGYRLEVDDPNLVYSPEEKTTMVITSLVLPEGFEDTIANHLAMDGKLLRIRYDYAPLVDRVQSLLTSEADRILCANPLARHFLPSYVYMDVTIQGGNASSKIAADLISDIESLQPTDALDVSQLENALHRNSVIRYDHPLWVITVTHDLDRRMVGVRSMNRIDDDAIVYNGSNRISFFIPGPDQSNAANEEDIPDGERIRITRQTPTGTV